MKKRKLKPYEKMFNNKIYVYWLGFTRKNDALLETIDLKKRGYKIRLIIKPKSFYKYALYAIKPRNKNI